jgi:hypothetical protein|tara:strand:+ start:839 stop:1066 length:228 start_codon:yes stop_codon:yes gene_type:complete
MDRIVKIREMFIASKMLGCRLKKGKIKICTASARKNPVVISIKDSIKLFFTMPITFQPFLNVLQHKNEIADFLNA